METIFLVVLLTGGVNSPFVMFYFPSSILQTLISSNRSYLQLVSFTGCLEVSSLSQLAEISIHATCCHIYVWVEASNCGQWEDKALITLPLSLVSAQLLYEIVNDMAVIMLG